MSLLTRCIGLALLAAWTLPSIGQAQVVAPTVCDWVMRASSPVGMTDRGDQATYMPMGPATLIMLTGSQGSGGGTITVSGLAGPGTYPVGAMGPGGSGAIITLLDQNGAPVPLSSGDGSLVKHQGAVIGTLPPPAQLAIQSVSNNTLRADLSGTFFRIDAAGQHPPSVVLVPMHISFTAAPVVPSIGARPCS